MKPLSSGSIARLIPDTHCYKWVISNLHSFQQHKKLTSPLFKTGAKNENTWCLEFYDTCKLNICLKDCTDDTIVKAIIQVYSPNEEKTMELTNAPGIFNTIYFSKGSEEFLYEFPELRDLCRNHGWLKWPHNQLTIVCEIKHELTESSVQVANGTLLSAFGRILKNGHNSDVKIEVDNKELPAHKFMLAMRSPVFASMLKHDGLENQRDLVIRVTGVDYATIEKLVEYVYTGRVTNIDKAPEKLLLTANNYELEGLKYMCSNVLIEQLNTSNLCKTLKVAVECKADVLKARVLDYISLHNKDDLPLTALKAILPDLK